jgi:hypothetical protein
MISYICTVLSCIRKTFAIIDLFDAAALALVLDSETLQANRAVACYFENGDVY